ncbi:MAG: methionyl-tRNA formyltransferase [Gammaproteobacteria bacterium]|nr:methionyl-tRNA formyltransferase [Gammaproteobacteria bacterium]
MNIGFAGTPAFAATILDALCASQHNVALVLSQPERRTGRGQKLTPSYVAKLAATNDIPVHTPTRLRGFHPVIESLDVLVVAAYGMLLPDSMLQAPRLGCLNVHASLLPRWRGAAPIEHAILHGDHETGVSIVQMTAKLDAGPVYLTKPLALTSNSTTASVTTDLAHIGASALLETLDQADKHGSFGQAVEQDEAQVTFAPKIPASAGQIDWSESAQQVARHIRAFHGRDMAFSFLPYNGRKVRVRVLEAEIWDRSESNVYKSREAGKLPPGTIVAHAIGPIISCGSACLRLLTLQLSVGKGRPMSGRDAINGYADIWRIGGCFEAVSGATPRA